MNLTMKKLFLCAGVLSITLTGCGLKDTEKKEDKKVKEETVALIKNDLYVEPVNPSTAQIKAFNKLSKAVEEQNYEEEAKMAAVSFAFDFFTLANKSGSEDVGGLQFIPTTENYRFRQFAQAYYYNSYTAIINEYGKDALPRVSGYKVESITQGSYTFHKNACDGYDVVIALTYEKSDFPEKKLKKKITVSMINITDFPYDRSKTYKDVSDFDSDKRINAYRVLNVQ